MLSQAVEDYLKTIYKLQGEGPAPTTEIARALGVSPASVTSMAKRLDTMGLANYASYRGVSLTSAGEKIALEIIRHHRLLETYLKEILDYPWDQMHEEAEHLEHHISEEFEAKIDKMLGYPTHDPHGDPIPSREGHMTEPALDALPDAAEGETLLIGRVSDRDPDTLSYLESVGLLPGSQIKVTASDYPDGPITVSIRGSSVSVGPEIARHVFTMPADR